VHGHSFELIFKFVGNKDPLLGWVIDYNDIHKEVQPLLNDLDHRLLNEINGLSNPTSENLAEWLYIRIANLLPQLKQVSVRETPNSECSFPA
jgi:6-pyruvoyltetrahydropterin/6-carboxytetrahydropterin synthase